MLSVFLPSFLRLSSVCGDAAAPRKSDSRAAVPIVFMGISWRGANSFCLKCQIFRRAAQGRATQGGDLPFSSAGEVESPRAPLLLPLPSLSPPASNVGRPAIPSDWLKRATSESGSCAGRYPGALQPQNVSDSECRDGIRRRTGAAANGQRSRGEQEIPARLGRRRIRRRLQVAVIEQMRAKVQQREIVNGPSEV